MNPPMKLPSRFARISFWTVGLTIGPFRLTVIGRWVKMLLVAGITRSEPVYGKAVPEQG